MGCYVPKKIHLKEKGLARRMIQNQSIQSQENSQFDVTKISGIVVSTDFLDALFNIEKKYHLDMRYSLHKNETHPRKLHHVLKSDLITALALHLSCNTAGVIREVTLYRLYRERVSKIFPISFQEFLYSIEKFELNELIGKTKNPYTNRISININYFVNAEKSTEKPIPLRYITVNPSVILSKEFLKLSVSHWKVYFGLIWRAGSNKNYNHRVLFDKVVEEGKSLHQGGLKQFLLKQQNSDVRKVIYDLVTISIGEHGPLILHTEKDNLMDKKFNRWHEANYRLNPNYHTYKKEGEKVRFPLEPIETYTRQANYIQNAMEKEGIGELATTELKGQYNGSLYRNIVYILKDQSRKMINHAIFKLKEYWKETGVLPYDLENFVKRSIRYIREAEYTKIIREEGLYDYLVYGYKNGAQRDQRVFDFINYMSRYSIREFRFMCKEGSEVLDRWFTEKGLGEGYRYYKELDFVPGIRAFRKLASELKVDVEAYENLEERILETINKVNPSEYAGILNMFRGRLENLPKVKEIKPATYYGFKLEAFLTTQYNNFKERTRNAWKYAQVKYTENEVEA